MSIPEDLKPEIARRRASDIGYLLVNDEWIVQEILNERKKEEQEQEEARKKVKAEKENKKKIEDTKDKVNSTGDGNTFSVEVNYSQTLAEMIAAGKYDRKNDDINEKYFPIPKIPAGPVKVALNLELVHFNRFISSDEVIAELKKRGLLPATLPELLAFGVAYPEKQREFPIVALGSVRQDWHGRSVPCLWGLSGGRHLDLLYFEVGWHDFYRFLAVREV